MQTNKDMQHPFELQKERDDLYDKFEATIYDVQQKSGFKNLLLEKKVPRFHSMQRRLGLHAYTRARTPWYCLRPQNHSTKFVCIA
jgi:hypothetical protein